MTMKQDFDFIRKFIHEICNHERNSSDTLAKIVPGPVLNRLNEPRHTPERNRSGVHPKIGSSRHHLSQGQTPANPVSAFTNLPNNGTGSAPQVSNDPHLALNARPYDKPAPPALPAPRTGQPADRPTSAQRTGHDDEIARRGTNVDAAVAVAEGALTEKGSWYTVRRQLRTKKNNKITGTVLHGNGSLIGMKRIFDLYLIGCAIQTSEIEVLSYIRDQCKIETKCEAPQCCSSFFSKFLR